MLVLTSVGELAAILNTSSGDLFRVADRVNELVQVYELIDPSHPSRKNRIVLCPIGKLRRLQTQLLRALFRRRLPRSKFSFGGVPGRNAVQNARRHLHSRYAYTTDIQDFFPSISFWQLRQEFQSRLKCSQEVSQLLARLCTHDGNLAQGLITSPILADQLMRRCDARIAGICEQHDLTYSRFVDDITVSGSFPLDLDSSWIVQFIRRIIADCQFAIAGRKEKSGELASGEISITGLRQLRGHLDPVADYVTGVEERLEDHRRLGLGESFAGPLFMRPQLCGRVNYICGINPGRSRVLRQRLGNIDWDGVQRNATERGLLVCKKTLRPVR
jgi:hypothetical protein